MEMCFDCKFSGGTEVNGRKYSGVLALLKAVA